MSRRKLPGSRGIITGASSGIGRELAIELAKCRCRLVLVARGEDALAKLRTELLALGHEVQIVAGDITADSVRSAAIELAKSRWGGLDFVVNNAGIGALGRFETASPERLRRIMEVNFFATAEMIRAALPLLKQGNAPIVVNVSSILGHRGIPHSSEYCASKFAVQGLSESLRAEFSRLGIDLLVVSPGTTQTEFFEHAIERVQTPWPEQKGVPAKVVARRIVSAMKAGRHEIVVNPRGKLLVIGNRFFPRLMDRFLERFA